MIALPTTTPGGALISALSAVGTAGTFSKCLGAMMHHTTDANCVMEKNASSGTNFATLKVTVEKETDQIWFPQGGYPLDDVYYTLSAGTLILYVE